MRGLDHPLSLVITQRPQQVARWLRSEDEIELGDRDPAPESAGSQRLVRGLPRSELFGLDSARVSELVTNVVLHSSSTEVTVLVSFDGVALTVEGKDLRRWLDRHAPRQVAEDDDVTFGRGPALVTACTSWWAADVTADGTCVVACCPTVTAAA